MLIENRKGLSAELDLNSQLSEFSSGAIVSQATQSVSDIASGKPITLTQLIPLGIAGLIIWNIIRKPAMTLLLTGGIAFLYLNKINSTNTTEVTK